MTDTNVVVPAGATVVVDANVRVRTLTVEGTLTWDTAKDGLELRSGFVLVQNGGIFNLGSEAAPMRNKATIYITANGADHPQLGERFLGAFKNPLTATQFPSGPTVEIHGVSLARTWALLAATVEAGATQLTLSHDANSMGWRVGDSVGVTTTFFGGGKGRPAEVFTITAIAGTRITLSAPTKQQFLGDVAKKLQAEVVNFRRNVLITGDDFIAEKGLHTIAHSGGVIRITHTQVEKCGQRGVLGRYCLHLHLLKSCARCLFRGNFVTQSFQRGVVVHGSHHALVEGNIIWGVKGAGIYVEDGNEMDNTFKDNVVVCPEDTTNKYGCRVQGTDNEQADYVQQSGCWALSVTNNWVGNRFAGTYNGFFTQTSAFGGGKGAAKGKVCTVHAPFGRMEGNVNHGTARFGFYLDHNWPRQLQRSVASNGYVVDIANVYKADAWSSCQEFKDNGDDNGHVSAVVDGLDFFNNLVGQYDLGDIQWLRFNSINNNHGMYWKSTKNFADGCTVHVKDSVFRTYDGMWGVGLFLGPGGLGAFVFENTEFSGGAGCAVCANQHCQVGGGTGVLCTPEYVMNNVKWGDLNSRTKRLVFKATGDSYGDTAIFTSVDGKSLAPFTSIVHPSQTHLLANRAAQCQTADAAGVGGLYGYKGAIVCKSAIRRLQVWSANQGTLNLNGPDSSVCVMKFLSGSSRKQGYGCPVMAGGAYSLNYNANFRPSSRDPMPTIEFSDITFDNVFKREDTLTLTVNGKPCPNGAVISSNHDRHYIGGHGVQADNRGACSVSPNQPAKQCVPPDPNAAPTPRPTVLVTPGDPPSPAADKCGSVNCGPHGACQPATGMCLCSAGFSGLLCEVGPVPAATCRDGKKNGDETGVDCGGAACPPCKPVQWKASAYSPCSKSCGGGVRTRTVQCVSTATGQALPDDSQCLALGNELHPTSTTAECNTEPCPLYTWQAGPFSQCSALCGTGEQEREVHCRSSVGEFKVDDTKCSSAPRPETKRVCSNPPCTGHHWRMEAWGSCTSACGKGIRYRVSKCYDAQERPAEEALCAGSDVLDDTMDCAMFPCANADWVACAWNACTATCGGAQGGMTGYQTRSVMCADKLTQLAVDKSLCSLASQPLDIIEGCGNTPCTAVNWMTSAWGSCLNGCWEDSSAWKTPAKDKSGEYTCGDRISYLTREQKMSHSAASAKVALEFPKECGVCGTEGKRFRTSHCHLADGRNGLDEDCPATSRPVHEERCEPLKCPAVAGPPPVAISAAHQLHQLAHHPLCSCSALSIALSAAALYLH